MNELIMHFDFEDSTPLTIYTKINDAAFLNIGIAQIKECKEVRQSDVSRVIQAISGGSPELISKLTKQYNKGRKKKDLFNKATGIKIARKNYLTHKPCVRKAIKKDTFPYDYKLFNYLTLKDLSEFKNHYDGEDQIIITTAKSFLDIPKPLLMDIFSHIALHTDNGIFELHMVDFP